MRSVSLPVTGALLLMLASGFLLVFVSGRSTASSIQEPVDPATSDHSPTAVDVVSSLSPSPRSADASMRLPEASAANRRRRGEYAGPLVNIDGSGLCPRVARAYLRMRASAQRSGVQLLVRSGFRTRTHQARLYRRLGPRLAAKPGATLHHDATEADIRMRPGGGDRIHRWLGRHAGGFGFVQRYSWEPWHWGFVAGC